MRPKKFTQQDIPPLENGDRLTRAEFERRYKAMPHLKKAELIEGVVYMPSPLRVKNLAQTNEASSNKVPPLENGDRLTRAEFERRYSAMPNLKKAELIEGVVYMGSPLRIESHGKPHFNLITWLGVYCAVTPGVEGGDNSTTRLDLDNEPQPDVLLRIESGQSQISDDGYVEGAPEFIAEIAASSATYDMHDKLTAYRRNGVQEYLVWRTYQNRIDWFRLREGEYVALEADAAGVVRSEIFPGLWLAVSALLEENLAEVLAVLQQGLATAEHTDFVNGLNG